MRTLKRSNWLCTLIALSILTSAPLVAQDKSDVEEMNEPSDNPAARVAFEHLRRGDPATGRIPVGMRAAELAFAETLPGSAAWLAAQAKGVTAAGVTIDWQERGPGNQGGRTRALGIDVSDESVILAGSVSGGMWRSVDTGETWTKVTGQDQIHSVTTLVQDTRPGSEHIWYYGTGEFRANSANLSGDGIFRSDDGGKSWRSLASTSKGTPERRDQLFDNVHRLAFDASNLIGEELYAAGFGGIARSSDGGETWEEVLGGFSNNAAYTDVEVSSTGVVYATLSSDGRTVEGIYRSENGIDWVEITPAEFPNSFSRIVLDIAPSNEDIVYFFARTPGQGANGHSLWVYNHNGGNGAIWENRSSGLRYNTETYSNYCQSVRVHPSDEDVVFLGQVRVQRTTDGFRDSSNLITQDLGGQHADQHEYVFFPSNPNSMLSGHDGGVSICYNNSTSRILWSFRNRGYGTTQFYSVAIDRETAGNAAMIGGTQDNGTWRLTAEEGISNGQRVFGSDGAYAAISDGGIDHYSAYQNGTMFRSQYNENGSRAAYTRIDPVGAGDYFFIHPYTLDRADTRVMYLPEGRRLWRNSDLTALDLDNKSAKQSMNWTALRDTILPAENGKISAVATSKASPSDRVYYGTTRGNLYRFDNPTDESAEPVEISSQDMPSSHINSIVVDPENGDRVLVAFSSYRVQSIFFSENGGVTWTAVSGNLEQEGNVGGNGPSVSWVEILPINGLRYYFAGTTTGLYSTTFLDGMNTVWIQEGASTIGNVVVDMVMARPSDGFVGVATHGRGLFSATLANVLTPATMTLSAGSMLFNDTEVGLVDVDTLIINSGANSERPISGVIALQEGPFRILSGEGPFSITPGDNHEVVIEFLPDSVGLLSGRILVNNDASTPGGNQTVFLLGRGVKSSSSVNDRDLLTSVVDARLMVDPAKSSGTISFDVRKRGALKVEIIGVLGNLVGVLIDESVEEGMRVSLPFETSDFPSGEYFVRILFNDVPTWQSQFNLRR